MKNMENGDKRMEIISRMVGIARADSPWVWGFHPKSFTLSHAWYGNSKTNFIANNTLKYKKLDPVLRQQKRTAWNKPVLWPTFLIVVILIVLVVPAFVTYIRKEHAVDAAVKVAGE